MSWTPSHGIPRTTPGEGGGTAVLDNPPKLSESVNRTGGTMSPKTIGILITDHVDLDGTRFTGEVEPAHDPLYERQTVTLVRDDDHMTNAHDVEFRSSMEWPGPMAAFVIYNAEGAITHRCDVPGNVKIPGDYVLNLRKGAGVFERK